MIFKVSNIIRHARCHPWYHPWLAGTFTQFYLAGSPPNFLMYTAELLLSSFYKKLNKSIQNEEAKLCARARWLVPENLRKRWKLMLGDTKIILPKLLSKLGKIDIFLHDSLHTYEHMMFEFSTAWPHINLGGYLLSDDWMANKAFIEFAESKQMKIIGRLGIIEK